MGVRVSFASFASCILRFQNFLHVFFVQRFKSQSPLEELLQNCEVQLHKKKKKSETKNNKINKKLNS